MIGAFEEFGVFNAEFFGILSAVIESSKVNGEAFFFVAAAKRLSRTS